MVKAHLGVDVADGGGDGGSGSSSGGGSGGSSSSGNSNNHHNNNHSNGNSNNNHFGVPEDCVFARLLNKLNNEGLYLSAVEYLSFQLPQQALS